MSFLFHLWQSLKKLFHEFLYDTEKNRRRLLKKISVKHGEKVHDGFIWRMICVLHDIHPHDSSSWVKFLFPQVLPHLLWMVEEPLSIFRNLRISWRLSSLKTLKNIIVLFFGSIFLKKLWLTGCWLEKKWIKSSSWSNFKRRMMMMIGWHWWCVGSFVW